MRYGYYVFLIASLVITRLHEVYHQGELKSPSSLFLLLLVSWLTKCASPRFSRIQIFVTRFQASLPFCYYNSNSKLSFQVLSWKLSFLSETQASISACLSKFKLEALFSGSTLLFWNGTFLSEIKHFSPESKFLSRNRNFFSLIEASLPKLKLRFRNRSFDSSLLSCLKVEAPFLGPKLHFWNRSIFLEIKICFRNRSYVSYLLLQFKFEALFTGSKLLSRNQAFVSGIKDSFSESKLHFQNQLFLSEIQDSGIESSFPNCYYNSNWKLRVQDQFFISSKTTLQFKQNIDSANKALIP